MEPLLLDLAREVNDRQRATPEEKARVEAYAPNLPAMERWAEMMDSDRMREFINRVRRAIAVSNR